MQILLIANKFPYPARDGGSIATLSLARSMAALGHQITILAINTSKHYFDPDLVPVELSASVRFISVPVNTEINLFKLLKNFFFSSRPYNAERFISRAFHEKIKEILSSAKFDIIQLEGLYLASYLETIRKYSKCKVVMRAHNIEFEIWERTISQRHGIKKQYIRNLAARIRKMELNYLNSYDALLPITPRDEKKFRSLGCTLPSHVVPTGIDAGMLIPDYSKMEFPNVFHIGALDWMPNQEGLTWFFEKVWDKILERFPDLIFFLAGRNAPDHFRHLPYKNVVYLGEVEDANEFIRSKSVMIVPVLSGSGMRIKIIEGMALGKAVVTTSIGTEGISTTDGENVLIADDPEQFASAVCHLLEDRNYYLRIGENARKFVSDKYDNFSISSSLTAFYQRLR